MLELWKDISGVEEAQGQINHARESVWVITGSQGREELLGGRNSQCHIVMLPRIPLALLCQSRSWPLGSSLKEETATRSSILAWIIPWKRSLVGCRPWGHWKSAQLSNWACIHASRSCQGHETDCSFPQTAISPQFSCFNTADTVLFVALLLKSGSENEKKHNFFFL